MTADDILYEPIKRPDPKQSKEFREAIDKIRRALRERSKRFDVV